MHIVKSNRLGKGLIAQGTLFIQHYLGLMEKFLMVVFWLKIRFMDEEWNVIFGGDRALS